MRFGRLTVISQVKSDQWNNHRFECRCDCGNLVQVRASHLRRGEIQSCTCLREIIRGRLNYRHGDATQNNIASLLRCWYGMKSRCLNPKNQDFKYYGARGIIINFPDYE